MTKRVKITTASVSVFITFLVILFTTASVSGVSLFRINDQDIRIEKCDEKIEILRQTSQEQTKVLTEVQTDVKWIKEAIKNGN